MPRESASTAANPSSPCSSNADATPDDVLAETLERDPVVERLGHRLDAEREPRVSRLVHGAVDGREADAEERRIDSRELGDVGRDVSGLDVRVPREQTLEVRGDGRGSLPERGLLRFGNGCERQRLHSSIDQRQTPRELMNKELRGTNAQGKRSAPTAYLGTRLHDPPAFRD
jgi:hypothetical protein